jgi:hypothetical protein
VEHILPIPQKMSYHDIWIGFVASTYSTITYTEESMIYYRRYSEQVTNVEKVVHKNFFTKLDFKKTQRLKTVDIRATDMEAFKSLKILKDEDTILIIDLLTKHFRNYENVYFDMKLYKLLKKYNEEVFAGFRPSKRKRRAFRTATGMKLRTLTLFKL